MRVLRGVLFLALSALLSWHFLLRQDGAAPALPPPGARVELAVAPGLMPPPPETAPSEESPTPPPAPEMPEPETEPEPEPEPVPPPPERGDPTGDEDEQNADEKTDAPEPQETKSERARREVEEIRSSDEEVEKAAEEVSGKTRRGFRTVLSSAPGDQLAIARYFGEQLVLVPRSGLDPRRPHYFRVDAGTGAAVERVDEKAPLDRFRQYRDFFAFEYGELPGAVRTLRRKVPVRSDVFLFAALIPPSEWAVVMARRAAALEACRREPGGESRGLESLRRVEMRYVRLDGGAFDIEVKQLVFEDGSSWTQQP